MVYVPFLLLFLSVVPSTSKRPFKRPAQRQNVEQFKRHVQGMKKAGIPRL
jgi:hypothetical protein